MWEYQMLHLAERGFRCIAYDRRGCGRSDQPGHGHDFDTLADDLAAVIGALDLRGVDEMVAALRRDRPAYTAAFAVPFFGVPVSPEMMQWGIGLALQASAKTTIDMI